MKPHSILNASGNENSLLLPVTCVASFPGLQSPNAVEGLVKLLHRLTSGGRLEAWLIAPCMHNCTAVHRKCHASRRPPDVILHRSFTRPSTVLGDRRPGNEAITCAVNAKLKLSSRERSHVYTITPRLTQGLPVVLPFCSLFHHAHPCLLHPPHLSPLPFACWHQDGSEV